MEPPKGGLELERARSGLRTRVQGLPGPFAIERIDDLKDYGEPRFILVGMGQGAVILFVAYTERADRIRIISARRAN